MSSFAKNTVLSGLIALGAGITGVFAQTKNEMKLCNLLQAPEGVSVIITPVESSGTSSHRQARVDYFMESLDEPGVIRTLRIDAVDGLAGETPNDTIGIYDIRSFQFKEMGPRGTIEISGQYEKGSRDDYEDDYKVSSKYMSTPHDAIVEQFSVESVYEVEAIRKLLGNRQP